MGNKLKESTYPDSNALFRHCERLERISFARAELSSEFHSCVDLGRRLALFIEIQDLDNQEFSQETVFKMEQK